MASSREWLVYTTAVGGLLQLGSPEFFDEALRTGELDVSPVDSPGGPRTYVKPVYMALLKATRDWDFVAGAERRD